MTTPHNSSERSALVLGGAGFIGSHLVEDLLAGGSRVTVVDSMEYCYADNLEAARSSDRLTVITADVTRPDWEVEGHFDEIFHLAGVVATGDFVARPTAALWTSLLPLAKLLRYRADHRPEVKLLFASSSEVYGKAEVHPQPEEYVGHVDCIGPRSGYDEGKRAGESLIVGWARELGMDCACAIVRIFNTYGPRMTANGRLVPTMVHDALKNASIAVNRPGTQTRTLLDVRDCIRGLRKAIALQHPRPINIGGVETMPVRETAERIASAVESRTGRPVTLEWAPEIDADIARRRPDITRARELLDWQPTIPFEEGIERVIDYWQDR